MDKTENKPNFRLLFFRYYDKKIGDGTTTFSQTGIKKTDFTKLCTDKDFVLDDRSLRYAMEAMKLGDEEKKQLLEAAERAREIGQEG